MKERVLRYAGGYLKVRMTGLTSERFLNLCMARGITLWELSRSDREALCFFISIKDFRRIGPLVKKAGVHVKITGRFGLPFFYTETEGESCMGQEWRPFFWFYSLCPGLSGISVWRETDGLPMICCFIIWTVKRFIMEWQNRQ